MEDTPKQDNFLAIGIIVAIIAFAAAGYWWWTQNRASETIEIESTPVAEEPRSLGSEVLDKAQKQTAQKVTEEVPDTNPLGNVQSNPYRDYQNPFSN